MKEEIYGLFSAQVLENFSDAPMTPKQILHVIQTKGLKEMRSEALTHTHAHTHERLLTQVVTGELGVHYMCNMVVMY